MNCTHCQRDMSQCLDGRLPSGRRASVMQHLETCEECRQLWGEFQRAQELILRLPVRKVSADFHQRLWERIKAGEGTPDAVFNEPMPLLTKARYVLTGAAAAALLLVLLNVWDTGGGPAMSDALRVTEASLPQAQPLGPVAFAKEAARLVARDSRRLDEGFRTLERLPQGRVDETTFRVILESADGVKSVGGALLSLQRDQHLGLPKDMAEILSSLASGWDVNTLRSTRDVQTLRTNLQSVIGRVRRLERLPMQIMVPVVYGTEEQQDFVQRIGEMYRQQSGLRNFIHIEVLRQQPGALGPGFRLDSVNRDTMFFLTTQPEVK